MPGTGRDAPEPSRTAPAGRPSGRVYSVRPLRWTDVPTGCPDGSRWMVRCVVADGAAGAEVAGLLPMPDMPPVRSVVPPMRAGGIAPTARSAEMRQASRARVCFVEVFMPK